MMAKGGVGIWIAGILGVLLFSGLVSADKFEDEIKKITHYAEEYETGNINYAQLVVYTSSLNHNANELFGNGSISRQEQLTNLLGPPNEETAFAWNQDEQKDFQLDKEVPAWRKLIFDGRKIQIWIGAWPSIRKNNTENIIYNLHVDMQFKRKIALDNIEDKVREIESLALEDTKNENTDELARRSVQIEQSIGFYLNNNAEQCIEFMGRIIGLEHEKEKRDITIREVTLGKGKYGAAIARLEFCTNCENSWIGLNVYRNYRGGSPSDDSQQQNEEFNFESLKKLSEDETESQIKESIEKYAKTADDEKIDRKLEQKISALNQAWNEKSNQVWDEINKDFDLKRNTLSDEERQNYDWQEEQELRETRAKEMQRKYHEHILSVYNEIFIGFKAKEMKYNERNFEKMLLKTFREIKPETCDNSIDDNENGLFDCQDPECNSQICGVIENENGSAPGYCMRGECKVREEPHLLEKKCTEHKKIECEGTVIFKGADKNGCMLESICIPKEQKCSQTSDCSQPLCGISECMEGMCKVTGLNECRSEECTVGDKKTQECSNSEVITIEICADGIWKNTGATCESSEDVPEESNETFLGNECSTKEECPRANDVCSNGKCVTLPVIPEEIKVEPITVPKSVENNEEYEEGIEEESENPVINGIILSLKNMMGYVINGFDVEEKKESANTSKEEIIGEIINKTEEPEVVISPENESKNNEIERKDNFKEGERIENDMNENDEKKIRVEEHREPQIVDDGGFGIWGSCRISTSTETSEGHISFNGWGKQFEKFQELKNRYYHEDNKGWCKDALNDVLAQRKELEASFDNEFAKWFFEVYVANDAENWEEHISGIYELYWKDVELSKRIAEGMRCLGMIELPEHNLISIQYNTSYGSVTFWEEIKEVNVLDEKGPTLPVISPYMKIWELPPKEFIKAELKNAMNEQRFPGPSEEESERDHDGGLSDEDRMFLHSDKKFMKKLNKVLDKYDGNLDISIQLKDNDDLVFNMYVNINENDIMKMKPMPPELMPDKDATVTVTFDRVYGLVEEQERESKSNRIESPPWDQKRSEDKIEDIKDAIKIFFKIQGLIRSAEVTPEEAKDDILLLIKTFMWKIITSDRNEDA